jgi:pimeloyl-ACP methyl ester carboxylesterase
MPTARSAATGADPAIMSDEIRPFTIDVSEEVLDDLRARLRRTRWPDAEVVDDWTQGVPLVYLQEVCRYWADEYDWRARQAALNRFDQYVTDIDGVDIHFIHQRSPHAGALPIVLTHGWPGSIVEFQKVIEPLTEPTRHGGTADEAFHVIAPSIPGYGFSGKPRQVGWGVERIGDLWAELMARLGYERYVAQGGDWGYAITSVLAARHPDRCVGIHLNFAMIIGPASDPPTPAQQFALERAKYYQEWDFGYRVQQKTRPQTLGYGLADSPAGQAAWILEKFWAWTDNDGSPEDALTRDELLDDITIYWVTNSAASSARLYWESSGGERPVVTVPTGFAVFPREIVPPVREWVERNYLDIHHWSTFDRGGHFAAFEQPDAFVGDVRACFARFRHAPAGRSTS